MKHWFGLLNLMMNGLLCKQTKFSDSNNIFSWHESEDVRKYIISKISVDWVKYKAYVLAVENPEIQNKIFFIPWLEKK